MIQLVHSNSDSFEYSMSTTDKVSMRIGLGLIGIDDKDTSVVRSLMKLSPELKSNFELMPSSLLSDAWIFFVNADDENAMLQWQSIKASRPTVTAIMVYRENAPADAVYSIKLPLLITRVMATLKEAIAKKNTVKYLSEKSINKSLNILIVDDSLSVRKYMEQKLSELSNGLNLNVQFAVSGEDAIGKLKENLNSFDLIFLDVMMDNLNGYQVCKWVKSVRKEITVVMLTNRGSVIDKMRGSMSHSDAYLAKPPKDDELQAILNNLNP